jgi:signal transduction histidine kinase
VLNISSPIQLIEDGLKHAQKVYSGVYEFTNMVKQEIQMSKSPKDVKVILNEYLRLTAYKNQVILNDNLPKDLEINEPLFCTAIDNLIRNGLKYNDSPTKFVKIYFEDDTLYVEDNGRGMTNEEFIKLSQPYKRNTNQKETGTGLGLNICTEILKEHGFKISSEKTNNGTKIKIKTI